MNGIPIDPESPLHWIDRLLKNGERIDRSTTGAIVAAAGPAVVLGWFFGGLAWMPFAAFICILLYRFAKYYEDRDPRKFTRLLAAQEQGRRELEAIHKSALPDAQKEEMAMLVSEAITRSAKRTLLKP